jgi:glycosyltransferase involved in cell wall biosynthesis
VLRRFDLKGAQRVNSYAGNSRVVLSRIRAFYGRDAKLIRPPMSLVDPGGESPKPRHGFLTVGRLLRYKGYDQTIRVCSEAGYPLTVVGTGPDMRRLQVGAGDGVRFAGHVSEEELAELYRSATALVVTAEEDSGLTSLEANAFGCPVAAAAHGGNLESVIDGDTGVLFAPHDRAALKSALERVASLPFDRALLHRHAASHGKERFRTEILDWIGEAVA